jgi:catechol 2,3-dioxygenase-like lactoylglutathione lyase family enzyme
MHRHSSMHPTGGIMSRLQLALNVDDLDTAIEFYSRMFDTEPAKVRDGYANFAIADPPLKLVLFEGTGEPVLDGLPVASFEVGPEPRRWSPGRRPLGALDLVEVGELEPAQHELPQAQRRVAGRRVDEHGAEQRRCRRRTPGSAPPTHRGRWPSSGRPCTSSWVVGSSIAGAPAGIEPHLAEQRLGHLGAVGLATVDVQRGAAVWYQRSSRSGSSRRSSAPMRIIDQP